MMKIHRLALYKLTLQDNILFDQFGHIFDVDAYSRFKYGSVFISKQYALSLFEAIRHQLPQLFLEKHLWLTSSAYKFVPTASDAIANALFEHWSKTEGTETLEKVKIGRDILFSSDYGTLSHQERNKLMQKVNLHFESNITQYSPSNSLLIVDDIRITGAHEERLICFAQEQRFQEVFFVYVAQMTNVIDPSIEHWLNHTAIRNLNDLWYLWKVDGFMLNARICKFLLSYPKHKSLLKFAKLLPKSISKNIAIGMWQDGYAQMQVYKQNWQIWSRFMPQKTTQKQENLSEMYANQT